MATPRFGLRATKAARTKLALLDAFTRALETAGFDQIRVRDLCAEVEISEPTFFNYFGSKADLVTYFVQLWSIESGAQALNVLEASGARAALHSIFQGTAATTLEHPRILAEVIAAQARQETLPEPHAISPAEYWERFGDVEGLQDVPARGLESLLPLLLRKGVELGEFPADLDVDMTTLNLAAVFFGTPVVLLHRQPGLLADAWHAQVEFILGHHPRRSS